jgi:hypothetical protein
LGARDSSTLIEKVDILEKNKKYYEHLQQIISLLKPINRVILESDKSKISDIPQVMSDLVSEIITVSGEYSLEIK